MHSVVWRLCGVEEKGHVPSVRGEEGDWLYAHGDVTYEATPVADGEGAGG